MTHRGPFQPWTFCDSVCTSPNLECIFSLGNTIRAWTWPPGTSLPDAATMLFETPLPFWRCGHLPCELPAHAYKRNGPGDEVRGIRYSKIIAVITDILNFASTYWLKGAFSWKNHIKSSLFCRTPVARNKGRAVKSVWTWAALETPPRLEISPLIKAVTWVTAWRKMDVVRLECCKLLQIKPPGRDSRNKQNGKLPGLE